MADTPNIPAGPGQQESIGMGKSKRDPETPGLYYHPKAKTYVHVAHYAAADAVVRMGYRLVEAGQRLTKTMQAKLSADIAKQKAARDAVDGDLPESTGMGDVEEEQLPADEQPEVDESEPADVVAAAAKASKSSK